MNNTRRQLGPGETIRRLLGYMTGKYRIWLVVVLFCIVGSALANVSASLFMQTLIDDYITPMLGQSSPDFAPLLRVLGMMACIYLTGIVCTFIYSRVMVRISQGTMKVIRDDMFAHMQSLPIRYFDTHTHGDIMSYYTNDIDTLRQMMSQSIPQLFSSAMTIVAVIISMLVTSIPLTVVALCGVALMLKVARDLTGRAGKHFIRQQKAIGDLNGFVEETIHGQKVVKVFCHEEEAKVDFDRHNEALCQDATQANRFANILMPVMMNIGNLLYVVIAIVGGALAVSGAVGGLTLGALATFLQLNRSLTNPISQISSQFNAVVMALAGAGRIFALMDEEPEQDDGVVTLVDAHYNQQGELEESRERTGLWAWKVPQEDGGFSYVKLAGDVRFQDVDFGYDPEKTILHNITLYAEPGQKVAFVGATGAGKTTITNLINRFYDIADGKIRYDGININKIRKSDLRRSLGMVLQETNLFTGTVMENIRYGRLDATDEECIAAAQLANAHDFITRLPQGYNTMLDGDGGSLSQGQRQLLSIARAAVADPPVMILDEATSSIDTRTEAIVQQGMDALMTGRTVFVIAHRLSTVQNSDVSMVLELGHIIERGNHQSLIAQKGKYYQLYTGAFELE